MQNRNSNIEQGPRYPDIRHVRLSQIRDLRLARLQYHHVPQENAAPREESQSPQIQPQNLRPESKLKACINKLFNMDPSKAIEITVYLVLFFFIIDLAPLFVFQYEVMKGMPYIKEIRGSLETISANLMADPIMDIQIIDKKSICPGGFQPLKLGVWGGTIEGCFCENGDLFDSPCGKDQPGTCETVPETFPIEISELDGSIWCGKRAVLGIDYVKKAECPAGYKECYAGGCFLGGDCPVTKVEIASTGDKTKKFSDNKEKYLILTRKQGEFPLINIQITPNGIPCFNRDLLPKPTNNNPAYKLLAAKPSGCDKYGLDSHFSTKLDSQPTLDYYTQNNFHYSTLNLPYFNEKSKKTTSVLSWRTRMFTLKNDHCLVLDETFIQNLIKTFHHLFPSGEMNFYRFSFHFIPLLFFGLLRCHATSREFFESLKKLQLMPIFIMTYLPLVGLFLQPITQYHGLMIAKRYFAEFDSLGCFGEGQGSIVIRDYLDILQRGEVNFWMHFGILLSNGSAILVLVWCWIVQKRTSRQN